MQGAQASLLPDGRRHHLNHGPIDLIVEAFGPGREAACGRARERFPFILQELVDELPELRLAADVKRPFRGPVAQRMHRAVLPFAADFITPMAAVAGAVADEILAAMGAQTGITKAYVNNGGDIAFFIIPGERVEAAIAAVPGGRLTIRAEDDWRGMATSGWRGRSQSLGIADAVSVVAASAAVADAAATLIANAVDLPGHKAISRLPAHAVFPDSDLGDRLVTTEVGPLTARETAKALERGANLARTLLGRSLIAGAVLVLNDDLRHVGVENLLSKPAGALQHA